MENFRVIIGQWSARIKEFWTGLSLNQKVLLSGALLFVITAVIVSSASIFRSDYEPLFTGLAIEDAAAITAQLEELNIDYLLEDSGVPSRFFRKFESNRLETNLASYLIRLFLLHIIQVVHVHVSFGSP